MRINSVGITPKIAQLRFSANTDSLTIKHTGPLTQQQEDVLSNLEEKKPEAVQYKADGLEVTFDTPTQKVAFETGKDSSAN